MSHHDVEQADYGTGQKSLSVYLIGVVSCTILTLISFWAVMSGKFPKWETVAIIFISACIQFFVQLICFLRLNLRTEQSRINVMSLVFTGIILLTFVAGSLWIMHNLHYNMF